MCSEIFSDLLIFVCFFPPGVFFPFSVLPPQITGSQSPRRKGKPIIFLAGYSKGLWQDEEKFWYNQNAWEKTEKE